MLETTLCIQIFALQINPMRHVPSSSTTAANVPLITFQLKDKTGTISTTAWGKITRQMTGITTGQYVKIRNSRTGHFRDAPTLDRNDNSTTSITVSTCIT